MVITLLQHIAESPTAAKLLSTFCYFCCFRVSIATKSLSPAVSETLGPKHIGGHNLDLLGSCDVISQVIIQFHMCHFLSVILWNRTCISVGFKPVAHGEIKLKLEIWGRAQLEAAPVPKF